MSRAKHPTVGLGWATVALLAAALVVSSGVGYELLRPGYERELGRARRLADGGDARAAVAVLLPLLDLAAPDVAHAQASATVLEAIVRRPMTAASLTLAWVVAEPYLRAGRSDHKGADGVLDEVVPAAASLLDRLAAHLVDGMRTHPSPPLAARTTAALRRRAAVGSADANTSRDLRRRCQALAEWLTGTDAGRQSRDTIGPVLAECLAIPGWEPERTESLVDLTTELRPPVPIRSLDPTGAEVVPQLRVGRKSGPPALRHRSLPGTRREPPVPAPVQTPGRLPAEAALQRALAAEGSCAWEQALIGYREAIARGASAAAGLHRAEVSRDRHRQAVATVDEAIAKGDRLTAQRVLAGLESRCPHADDLRELRLRLELLPPLAASTPDPAPTAHFVPLPHRRSPPPSVAAAIPTPEPTPPPPPPVPVAQRRASLLERLCPRIRTGSWAGAAALLNEVEDPDELGLGEAPGVIYFNASLVAVRARDCEQGRALAARAALWDDPFRLPSNLGWLRTLQVVRDCSDLNLRLSVPLVKIKPVAPELCGP